MEGFCLLTRKGARHSPPRPFPSKRYGRRSRHPRTPFRDSFRMTDDATGSIGSRVGANGGHAELPEGVPTFP